jgi:hypothetical protein
MKSRRFILAILLFAGSNVLSYIAGHNQYLEGGVELELIPNQGITIDNYSPDSVDPLELVIAIQGSALIKGKKNVLIPVHEGDELKRFGVITSIDATGRIHTQSGEVPIAYVGSLNLFELKLHEEILKTSAEEHGG